MANTKEFLEDAQGRLVPVSATNRPQEARGCYLNHG